MCVCVVVVGFFEVTVGVFSRVELGVGHNMDAEEDL